jgi:hypothetical protein
MTSAPSTRTLRARAATLLIGVVGVVLAFGGLGGLAGMKPAGAAVSPGAEGLVVDRSGNLSIITYGTTATINSFNSVDTWPGWDIARGVALRAANPTTCASFGGYTLDGWGALHPFGINNSSPPRKPTDGPYWRGWDIARNVALVPSDPRNPDSPPAGGFVLDGFGGLHYFTIDGSVTKPVITGAPYWHGWDIARGLIILTTPGISGGYRGGFVVDAWGGLHPFNVDGNAPDPVNTATAPYWPGWDIVRGGTPVPGSGLNGGLTLDAWGGVHPFTLGSGPAPNKAEVHGGIYLPGANIARGIVLKPKKVCP